MFDSSSLSRILPCVVVLSIGCDKVVSLEDEHNYSYSGTIDIPAITTASGTDLDICWDQALEDIRCHDIDPGLDINSLALISFPGMAETDLEDKLARDALLQSEQDGVIGLDTEDTQSCAKLSEMDFFGTKVDDLLDTYVEGDVLFLLTLATGNTAGVGTRLMVRLDPDASSDVTEVNIEGGCDVVDFTADLSGLTKLPMGADGPFVVEWGALTKTGLNNTLELSNIDGLMLAFYEGTSPAELEPQFLDLELAADKLYTLDIAVGIGADLVEATDSSGAAFGGFSGDGTWLLALTCSTCANPAPLFMTVVEVQ